jgi:hypothetical protein
MFIIGYNGTDPISLSDSIFPSEPTFRRNVSPPSSGSKQETRMKQSIHHLAACLMLISYFDPEGEMSLRNVG